MSNAEDVLNGLLCRICGCLIEDMEEPGFPRTCEDCFDEE